MGRPLCTAERHKFATFRDKRADINQVTLCHSLGGPVLRLLAPVLMSVEGWRPRHLSGCILWWPRGSIIKIQVVHSFWNLYTWGGSDRTCVGERPRAFRDRGTVWDDSGREVILQPFGPYVTPAL
jgi:hypothetical protein